MTLLTLPDYSPLIILLPTLPLTTPLGKEEPRYGVLCKIHLPPSFRNGYAWYSFKETLTLPNQMSLTFSRSLCPLLRFCSYLTDNLLACLFLSAYRAIFSYFKIRLTIDRIQSNFTPLSSKTQHVCSASFWHHSAQSFSHAPEWARPPPTADLFNSMLLLHINGRFLDLIFTPITVLPYLLIFRLFSANTHWESKGKFFVKYLNLKGFHLFVYLKKLNMWK